VDENEAKAQELAEIVRQIRERVRQRYPSGESRGVRLPDLMPAVYARDAAEAKVAAIGRVNPRPGGALNAAIQGVKKLIARALDWHVRDQVDFNRGVLNCIEALIEAHNESNRALVELANRVDAAMAALDRAGDTLDGRIAPLERRLDSEVRELKDIRTHWPVWREEWQRKLMVNETQFVRGLADLQVAFQHRATLQETNYREIVAAQNQDFHQELARRMDELQARLWKDLDKIRIENRGVLNDELRFLRQRAALTPPPPPQAAASVDPPVDWLLHGLRFRGPESSVERNFERYVPVFRDRLDVLDIGCGRGEFLSLVPQARGVDLNPECVAVCRSKGLPAEEADAFGYLASLPDASLDGIFCAQTIEHLPPMLVPELVSLCAAKLRPGAPIAFETPNPECLAIFATHFYLDPTHTKPIPPKLLIFYLQSAGFGEIEIERFSPAKEHFPALSDLPEEFFGGMDYSAVARRKLS
jgi:O-antigen chain-terminating methyltransferase